MPYLRFLTLFCLSAAFAFGAAAPAQAQQPKYGEEQEKPEFFYQYDKKHRPSIEDMEREKKGVSVLGQGIVRYSIPRDLDGAPGDFILRIASPFAVSGCAEIENPEIEVVEQPPILALTIKEGRAVADKKSGKRYAHYECNAGANFAMTDIPLNRDDLIESGINKITLRSTTGAVFNGMDIEANKNRIKVRNVLGEIERWFYPPNTIILYAPSLKPDHDLTKDLLAKARAKGLVPMEEVMEDFKTPDYFRSAGAYFLDPMGVLHREIEVAGKPVFFGKVQIEETYFGPGGEYKKPVEVDLYAKIPSAYE